MSVFDDPRVQPDVYVVRPSCYDALPEHSRHDFELVVVNGHAWGWSVRQRLNDSRAMNRKGEWIFESRGSGHNKTRRWPLEAAIALALQYVETRTVFGKTAQEWAELEFNKPEV